MKLGAFPRIIAENLIQPSQVTNQANNCKILEL